MMSIRSIALALALPALAAAGNVCLAISLVFGFGDAPPDVYYVTFAAGSPCDDGRSAALTNTISESWCSIANRAPEFEICGTKATIVNGGEPIGQDDNNCGAKLSINGQEYDGKVLDSNAADNPCSADCNIGIAFGNISGVRLYENVPMCD